MAVMTIGEICDLLNGYSFKSDKYENDGIRVIRIQNVQKGYLEDPTPVFYPKKYEKELKKYMLEENDILVSLTGNVGRVALMEKRFLPAGLNQRVACLRIKNKSIVDIKYLFYILLSKNFEDNCIFSSHGAAQLNLSTEWIKNYKIPVPTLSEQKKIVEELDLISSAISENEKRLDLYDEMIKSKFNEIFGDPDSNTKKWVIKTIDDISQSVNYGTSIKSRDDLDGKYKYLRMNNMTDDGYLNLEDLKSIDLTDNEFEKCEVKNGDLLFNRTNSYEHVGRTCVFNLSESMAIAGFIIRVRLKSEVLPEFVSKFLNMPYSKILLKHLCSQSVNQANINAEKLKKIKIFVPPISIQQEFVEYERNIKTLEAETLNKIKNYQELLDSKMNEYFN